MSISVTEFGYLLEIERVRKDIKAIEATIVVLHDEDAKIALDGARRNLSIFLMRLEDDLEDIQAGKEPRSLSL